jgi:hypothetical protein
MRVNALYLFNDKTIKHSFGQCNFSGNICNTRMALKTNAAFFLQEGQEF